MRTKSNGLLTNTSSGTVVDQPKKPQGKEIKPLFQINAKSIKEDTRDGDSPQLNIEQQCEPKLKGVNNVTSKFDEAKRHVQSVLEQKIKTQKALKQRQKHLQEELFLEYTIRQQLDEEAKMHKREEVKLRGEASDFLKRIKEVRQVLKRFRSQQNDQMLNFSLIKQDQIKKNANKYQRMQQATAQEQQIIRDQLKAVDQMETRLSEKRKYSKQLGDYVLGRVQQVRNDGIDITRKIISMRSKVNQAQ